MDGRHPDVGVAKAAAKQGRQPKLRNVNTRSRKPDSDEL
jgi:hypothetical protein